MDRSRPDTLDDHILGVLGLRSPVPDMCVQDVPMDGDGVGHVRRQRGHQDEVAVGVILVVVGWNIFGSRRDGPVGQLLKVPRSHIPDDARAAVAWDWVVPVFPVSPSSWMDSATSVPAPVSPWGVIVEDEVDGEDEVDEAVRGNLVEMVFGLGAHTSEHPGVGQWACLLIETLVRHLEVVSTRPMQMRKLLKTRLTKAD